MIDIQNQCDTREVPLQKVGVKNLQYPITVLDRAHKTQVTSSTVNLFVNLPKHFKGTHMSRFIEVFHKYHHNLSMHQFLQMLQEMRYTLDAEEAFGEVKFTFFVEKEAPISKQKSMMAYNCTYEGVVRAKQSTKSSAVQNAQPVPQAQAPQNVSAEQTQTTSNFFVSVSVPVTTLCPCSKAISANGAHNQRGVVTVKVQNSAFFWIEDIINLVENASSCALYSLLKREDEKFVTEHAYDNPRFVEDLVREVYLGLQNFASGKNPCAEKPFSWFSVEAENFESIHNHNAYAYTEFVK